MTSPKLPVFLIITVGGAPPPVVAAIKHWHPVRVVFVVSKQSRDSVTIDSERDGKFSPSILTALNNNDITDFAGRYECFPVEDHQDYSLLVRDLRKLDRHVASWRRDYGDIKLVVDITGGTKAMSAAMALTASRWLNCVISYVGGSERTKDGVGVVVDGKEQINHVHNPWMALGYLVEEQIRPLFNSNGYASARQLLEPVRDNVESPRKEELSALIQLCTFFELWDTFQHQKANKLIPSLRKNWNNLCLDETIKARLDTWLRRQGPLLDNLCTDDSAQARHVLALDLLANANRRFRQENFDDAVARLYRCIEALAQARLYERGFQKTSAVVFAEIPDALQKEWETKPRDDQGCLKLGLQDAYTLLLFLEDDLGRTFADIGLADKQKSPLVMRNASILAHGYQSVSKQAAKALLQATLKLAGIGEQQLTVFPEI